MKHGADGWATSPDPVLRENLFRMLAAGKVQPAIVVSHSCEIDKGKPRVLVAQIALLNTLEPAQQEKVLAQRAYSHMPLPALPQLGDCYADFRTIGAVHADTVRSAARIATMTPDALVNFQARLVGFLTRLAMPV